MADTRSLKARWAIEHNREKLVREYNVLRRNERSIMPGGLLGLPGVPGADLPAVPPNRRVLPGHELPPYVGPTTNIAGGSGAALLRGPGPTVPPPRKVGIVGGAVAGLYIALILEKLEIPNLEIEILEANERVGGIVWTHNFSDKKHDYYDVGTMRFPDIRVMKRTFDLFEYLKIETRPYFLSGPKTPALLNNRFFAAGTDPYGVSVSNGGSVPDDVADDWSKPLDDAFDPYKKEFKHSSSRMAGLKGELPKQEFFSIQWMETQNTATDLFDQSFSESVIDSFDFDGSANWYCIEGGTTRVTDAMVASLKNTTISTKKRVVTIGQDTTVSDDGSIFLKVCGEQTPREGYSSIFSSAPLGCLARMDLDNFALHPSTRDAIRCLHYDDSVKVVWPTLTFPSEFACIRRTTSNDPENEPAVLLVSYTWSQDAARVGSLLKSGKEAEDELIDFVLCDIARLHAQTVSEKTVRDTFTGVCSGAFAIFGPGQFRNLYPYLIRPAADGKFHIVGEASSSHHAWIVGALDSAYYAVAKFLFRFGLMGHIQTLKDKLGDLDELDDGTYGSLHMVTYLGQLQEGQHVKV
ncbi:L-amino-acid oxidase [Podospora fimiseda]|uniref:L-amino-acid oxidase n=1 Tax=Podospora fimiseda TaxID=252190 RepID=A0AAN7GUI9_9PEZI|nr:L-amino-acid oxidase [Podospora fimiseda]